MSSSSKFARGTGRGQSRLAPPQKRGIIPPRHGLPPKDRVSLGANKDGSGYTSAGNGGLASSGQEENYQLLASPVGGVRPFAMMIRLTPEILEELKQAEEEGNKPMMKFGANAAGHVIKVGPEDFMFSSAPEPGDLCDIYEQRSRDDGEVLLVEAGSVWRKLSVQRFLSATEKDRVKKRTAEAEKKQKLRKSILVDPSTQMIIPQAAAVEANGRKPMFKPKKEPPPKKRKVTMSPVAPSVKQRPQMNPLALIGNHRNEVPASPSPEAPTAGARGASLTQTGGMHPPKERSSVAEGAIGPPAMSKGNSVLQKEKVQPAASTAGNESGGGLKMGSAGNMTELRNFLITLLKENPKGVTIKAVEKAIAEGMPTNPGKKHFEKVIKSIASYCAPGKYLLNPEVEKGGFMEVTPVTSEQVSERIQETVVVRTRDEETSAAANREAHKKIFCERLSDIDMPNVRSQNSLISHHLLDKEVAVQPAEPQLPDLPITQANSPKPNVIDAKEGSSEGTDSSSSSGSGSESDSDSDSSESGSESDSGSGSGSASDSEASSSSSDANMDEDVDIMSDDENENKSDLRQKPKAKEAKSLSTKQDIKFHKDDSLAREGSGLRSVDKHKPSIEEGPLRSPIVASVCLNTHDTTESVALDRAPENLIEQVFGPDEDSDVRLDTNIPSGDVGSKVQSELHDLSSTHKKHVKAGSQDRRHINNSEGKRKSSWKTQGSQEDHGKNGFDQDANMRAIEVRPSKRGKQSILSVEMNLQERDVMNNNMRHVKSSSPVVQRENSKSPMSSIGAATSKGSDKHLIRSEAGLNNILVSERRDRITAVNDDMVSSRSLSLEASKTKPESSPLRLKDNLQKVGRPFFEESGVKQAPVKQHSSAELRKTYPKNTDTGEKYTKDAEKHDAEKRASEIMVTGKSPDDLGKLSHRSARNLECTSRLVEEGLITVRTPDRSVHRGTKPEQSVSLGKDDNHLPKEKFSERSMSKPTKAGETLGRHNKDVEAQRWQQKDVPLYGAVSKANANRFSKESDQSSVYERDLPQSARPNKQSSKMLKPSRQLDEYRSNDYTERAGLMTEQAERPVKDVDVVKRGKDISARESIKEAEPIGRPPLNGIPLSLLKEGKKAEVDTEPLESRKAFPHGEDSRSRQAEAMSRAVSKKGSISPDIEKSSLGKSSIELTKRSPLKVGNDLGRSLQDSRDGKRRLEDERADSERPPKKKAPSAQARHPNHSKQDRFSVSSGKEEAKEKTKPSTSDAQDHMTSSIRNSLSENNRKQANKDWGENKAVTVNKQKTSSSSVVASEKYKDNSKPEFTNVSAKKQTPQSSEVQGAEFFAPYEKKEPELRGLINSYEQYKEYCKEFKEKYPIYIRLNASLESDKEDFEFLRKEIEQAKCKDNKHKLDSIYGKVKRDYFRFRKRFKRMRQTFRLLHEELQVIKHRCKEYAEKVGQG